MCVSCIANPDDKPMQQPTMVNEVVNVDDIDMSQVYTYEPEAQVVEPAAETEPALDADFYRRHILVKGMGDDYIIYEYSDVRVDQVATLASRYCYDKDSRTSAYLRDIYMRKNHKRRATFDCIDLARD